ncbi:acylneuraminate cytidylyltransferase family protein [Methanoplanus limicola]|uniref:acylneuraminate cytidylyltransferase family protein n=1 Tax=Methanoplanus limicola TaxID=2315 RepID=UPI00145C656C|nr:acylneuraminate cytidylyltransferase family protein [Methanoplanus limicola]
MKIVNEVWAVIPARGGSKGIPKKNLIDLNGFPLIAYSIMSGINCNEITRTIVSTDSYEIANVAKKYGADIPFLRPNEISTDTSQDIYFILHLLNWYIENEGIIPKYLVNLRPTTPLRNPGKLCEAINLIKNDKDATSLRSVHELSEPPQKMMKFNGKYLDGFFPDDPRPEYYNLPRQFFPKAYHPNGYIDIYLPNLVLDNYSLYGDKVLGYITEYVEEIDTIQNYENLKYHLKQIKYDL